MLWKILTFDRKYNDFDSFNNELIRIKSLLKSTFTIENTKFGMAQVLDFGEIKKPVTLFLETLEIQFVKRIIFTILHKKS